jgi:hypothetical protein
MGSKQQGNAFDVLFRFATNGGALTSHVRAQLMP